MPYIVFTIKYVSLNLAIGKYYSNKLIKLAKNRHNPWLIACDFNEITHSWKKSNIIGVRYGRWSCFENYEVRDAGFMGSKFTRKTGICQERLKPSKLELG